MNITVTGASGFIGGHVVEELLANNLNVIATGTDKRKIVSKSWLDKVDFVELDLNKPIPTPTLQKIAASDKLIHLAWSGLPNYKELFHFEENLAPQYEFLKKVVDLGLKDITVTGTCFEYGLKSGPLRADLATDPQNPYALAKDCLRKFLQQLQTKKPFRLKWVRLFYTYGKGQSPKSILSQLERALANGNASFNMSGGEQLRDYLPVEEVARQLVAFCLSDTLDGVFNCCSGTPISIRQLVENYLTHTNQKIALNLGYYPYPDYEGMAFWGDTSNIFN